MSFQKGHKFSVGRPKQARLFDEALRRAVAQDNAKRIRNAAEKLLDLAASGEAWAIKELADRLDGRAIQSIDVTHSDDIREMTIEEIQSDLIAVRARRTGRKAPGRNPKQEPSETVPPKVH